MFEACSVLKLAQHDFHVAGLGCFSQRAVEDLERGGSIKLQVRFSVFHTICIRLCFFKIHSLHLTCYKACSVIVTSGCSKL